MQRYRVCCYSMKGNRDVFFHRKSEAVTFFESASSADWEYVVLDILNETRGVWEISREAGDKHFYQKGN